MVNIASRAETDPTIAALHFEPVRAKNEPVGEQRDHFPLFTTSPSHFKHVDP